MADQQIAVGFTAQATTFDEAGNAVWSAGADGVLRTVRLLDGKVRERGAGFVDPVAALPLPDGLRLVVVERAGDVWLGGRENVDRQRARRLTAVDGPVHGAALGRGGAVLVLHDGPGTGGATTRLTACTPGTAAVEIVADDLPPARLVAGDPARDRLLVLAALDDGSDAVLAVDLATGAPDTLSPAPDGVRALIAAPDGRDAVICGGADGRLQLVEAGGAMSDIVAFGAAVDGLTHWGRLLLATIGDGDVIAHEWDLDPGPMPLTLPLGPLAVDGWVRMSVDPSAVGLELTDLELAVEQGPDAGSVSAGVEAVHPDGTHPVMLLAGPVPGEYDVVAADRNTGDLLARRRFRVTPVWPGDDAGPPLVVTGPTTLFEWGGAGVVPAYTSPDPIPSRWRLAVLFVTTRGVSFGPDLEAMRAEWKDRIIGSGLSVRSYYEEVSYYDGGAQGTTVDLLGDRILGPITVDAGWGDVFAPNDPGDLQAGWTTKNDDYKPLADAVSQFMLDQSDGYEILRDAKAVVLIVCPGSSQPVEEGAGTFLPTEFVHAHASEAGFTRKDPATSTLSQGRKTPIIVTTSAYPPVPPPGVPLPPDEATFTMCHEMGHTLGLDDLYDLNGDYPAEILQREILQGDLMDEHFLGPHFSVANRIRLGWLPPSWVRRFDFTTKTPGSDVVELQAVETLDAGGPTNGRVAAVEVPIQDGWSYFFEYRSEQPGQVGDQRLDLLGPPDPSRFVLGTDVRVPRGVVADEPARPPILQLPRDVDGDGPLLTVGTDYQDSDVTNSARMYDFTATVTALPSSGDTAHLEIDYRGANRPQLMIHPAPGRGDFRSRDIQLIPVVPGSVAVSGPGLPEVRVVKGARNSIAVTVWNVGTLAATKVQIHVGWIPFTLTSGTPQPLKDPDPFDVPAGGKYTVEVPWDVPPSFQIAGVEVEHFCVRVDIDRWSDPRHPLSSEIVVHDNWAQSNFSTKWLRHGSPSERVSTAVTAKNVLRREARYDFGVRQNGEHFRVYLGSTWRRLDPGQEVAVELAYESLAGDPTLGDAFEAAAVETVLTSQVSLTSRVDPGPTTRCRTSRTVFGASVQLAAGRACWVDEVSWDGDGLWAHFSFGDPGAPNPVPQGSAGIATWPADDPGAVETGLGDIVDGWAWFPLSEPRRRLLADGVEVLGVARRGGDALFAECTSEVAPVHPR